MSRSVFGRQADEYAALAASARTPEDRELYLSMEQTFRRVADASRRVNLVRQRNDLGVNEDYKDQRRALATGSTRG